MTYSVFKRKRTVKGRVVIAKTYTGEFRLPGDLEPTRIALEVTDKRVAEQKIQEHIKRLEQERAGIALPKRLVDGASQTLLVHLADFAADLKRRGRCRRYVREIAYRIRGMLTACGWTYQRDITSDSFISWRARQEKSAKTLNDYLAAMATFCRWMKSAGRMNLNPLENVGRVDARGKQTFERRALTPGEFAKLLDVSGNRRPLYLTAVLTGLRRGALHGLRWGDVHLDAQRPFLAVRATTQKDKKNKAVGLREDLANELRGIRPADVKPTDRVFRGYLSAKRLTWFYADLEAAGIEEVDGQGRRMDFHALRHTACTWAGQTGIQGAIAQQFMGHADSRQTARYTHNEMITTTDLIERLPRFNLGTVGGTVTGTVSGVAEGQSVSQSVAVA